MSDLRSIKKKSNFKNCYENWLIKGQHKKHELKFESNKAMKMLPRSMLRSTDFILELQYELLG